jgi:alpha-beta hydrolase superfamily lysophospholipase
MNASRQAIRTDLQPLRGLTTLLSALVVGVMLSSCRATPAGFLQKHPNVEAFNFQVSLGLNQYQIAGYLARSPEAGRLPALLVLSGDGDSAERCIDANAAVVAMGIHVACVSIPGYGRSSGPSRFVGPQTVAASRRALDLLAARPEVDPSKMAVWGSGDGALAAGLLMDYDSRPRALILQSGAYDLQKLWRQAPIATKLAIIHQVWPSKRALSERSVIQHLPQKLDCSVLILHGQGDRAMPVSQAVQLASALRERGAHVETRYYPNASHRIAKRVIEPELQAFLRENLLQTARAADQPQSDTAASN